MRRGGLIRFSFTLEARTELKVNNVHSKPEKGLFVVDQGIGLVECGGAIMRQKPSYTLTI